MRTISILCSVVFLLSLAAWPVIDYAGGRSCMPVTFPPLWPAELTASAIGLLAAVVLVIAVIKSLLARRRRAWTIGALAVVIAAGSAFWFCPPELPGFLHGLRDRFVAEVGYPKMREFAKEMSQAGPEAIIGRPGMGSPPAPEQQRRWDDLVARYPFLNWTYGAGTVIVRGGIVELTWGSALTGHWGFQVAPDGVVKDIEKDRGKVLRVAADIQFIYYFD
ncbi:MAG: hypothetical protein NTZ17_05950 [Phycisphaerae bacterium]|nr:hypothetical protein [Phycisphaerae bacterium]